MNWKLAIRASNEGISGQVYYLNYRLIFPDKDEWTKGEPFTVNPQAGKTIQSFIAKSTDLNDFAKVQLIKDMRAELRDQNSVVLKLWVSEYEAPFKWGNPNLIKEIEKNHRGEPNV